jgi:hypothetical protein
MADQDLTLKIGADTSGLVTKIATAKDALSGIQSVVTKLAAAFKAMGANGGAGLDDAAAGAKGLADPTNTLAPNGDMQAAGQDMKTAYAALQDALTQLTGKGAADRTAEVKQEVQTWQKTLTPIVSSFTSGMLQMAEHAKSFRQVMLGVGQQVLDAWLKIIDKTVTGFLVGQITQVTAAKAGEEAKIAVKAEGTARAASLDGLATLKEIVNDAAAAAAGAFKALASNPFTLPLAPVGAAAAFAAVMAFQGLVNSAAGGWGDVPFDDAPALLHKNEMVLPASIANPLRANLAAGAGPGGGGAGGPDVHLHVHATDAASVARLFRNNGEAIADALRAQHRAGAFVGV